MLALPPRLDTRVEGGRVVGMREQDFQLIPRKPGPLAVPALELSWWDLSSGAPKVGAGSTAISRLPARTLIIGGAPGATATASGGGSKLWPWAAGGLALLALALLALRLQPRRHPLWALRRACRDGDAAAAHGALLAWAARRWPDAPPASLPEFAGRMESGELADALRALDRRLYGPAANNWRPHGLWRAALRAWINIAVAREFARKLAPPNGVTAAHPAADRVLTLQSTQPRS